MANNDKNKQKSVSKLVFKLDSGASDHLVNEKWCFYEYKQLQSPIVINVAKDNASLVADYSGKINGFSNKGVELFMKDVLYVPDLRDHLLSVRKLTCAGIDVKFCNDQALIIKDGEIIATAYSRHGLYEIELSRMVINIMQTYAIQIRLSFGTSVLVILVNMRLIVW